ncbi:MAG: hypothetical protein IKK33_10325 [Lachnospiraceae bacterium]|nr:hypothetical protein [Lachnospiraceae bacterium]
MKKEIWRGIALCMAIIGAILCFYSMFSENESSCFLALALLCITTGNLISTMLRKKQKERD